MRPSALLGEAMTLQEQKEHEEGLNELAFRSAMRDMAEYYGREKLLAFISAELKQIGIVTNESGAGRE